jgi:glycerol-3-phosphate cytidylyltransferase-like family protein
MSCDSWNYTRILLNLAISSTNEDCIAQHKANTVPNTGSRATLAVRLRMVSSAIIQVNLNSFDHVFLEFACKNIIPM